MVAIVPDELEMNKRTCSKIMCGAIKMEWSAAPRGLISPTAVIPLEPGITTPTRRTDSGKPLDLRPLVFGSGA